MRSPSVMKSTASASAQASAESGNQSGTASSRVSAVNSCRYSPSEYAQAAAMPSRCAVGRSTNTEPAPEWNPLRLAAMPRYLPAVSSGVKSRSRWTNAPVAASSTVRNRPPSSWV